MTWLVSWPTHAGPACETAPHQTAAEARAEQIVKSGRAATAVAWEIDGLELSE
jgi:hypothetical protein